MRYPQCNCKLLTREQGLIEARGHLWKFSREAEIVDGVNDFSQLGENEIVVYPGLIFRRLPTTGAA
jgi:hypothetical protein